MLFPNSISCVLTRVTIGLTLLTSASFASHNRTEFTMSKAVTEPYIGFEVGFSLVEGGSAAEESGVGVALLGVAAGLDSDASALDIGDL